MSEPDSQSPARRGPGLRLVIAAAILVTLLAAGFVIQRVHVSTMERRLLSLPPDAAATHKDLVQFATAQAKPLFARNCAVCHGANMKGLAATGAPDLTDDNWLYGDGDVFSIERTILYGVRSTHQKSHDVTEMPAFGLRGQLSDADIKNVVQYLLQLNHRPSDAQAAIAGKAVFFSPIASCDDCHGEDAKGNSDYGAPDLTANVWQYGGDPGSLYNSIYYGHHGAMPAWIGKLSLAQIRALAVYIHAVSHP